MDLKPARRGHSVRVLVVDDEAAIRHLVDRVLTRDGYDVIVAETVALASAALLDYPGAVHIALIDLLLPGGGSLEFADELARVHPGAQIFIMTGAVEEDRLVEAEAHGTLLMKPFTMSDLAKTISGDPPSA